jgi:hypothetical protein
MNRTVRDATLRRSEDLVSYDHVMNHENSLILKNDAYHSHATLYNIPSKDVLHLKK